ncbi:MAG: PTS lactose/cellobiose transporter subunit IIA [Lactobacillaceae bacterium]|nr:PTS lactose/cellobiose transporter subunit IIA [Lactobacillaceae bacterium]
MADEKRMEMVMGLIMHGGSIKGYALQAIKAAREGDFDAAKNFLQQSADEDKLAHDSQTEMLTKAAQGEPVPIDIYMVHAQDHVMTGIATRDLAVEMVALYQKLADENK